MFILQVPHRIFFGVKPRMLPRLAGTRRTTRFRLSCTAAEAIASKNYDLAYIYAGEAVGLVTRQQSAGDVIQYLGDGAERLLRERSALLLGGREAAREG